MPQKRFVDMWFFSVLIVLSVENITKQINICRAANNFFYLERTHVRLGHHFGRTKENLVGYKHKGTVERVAYKKVKFYLKMISSNVATKNWLDKMSDQSCDFVGHWQILVGHCSMTNCYLQPWSDLNAREVKKKWLFAVMKECLFRAETRISSMILFLNSICIAKSFF